MALVRSGGAQDALPNSLSPALTLQCKSWWMERRCALSFGTQRDR